MLTKAMGLPPHLSTISRKIDFTNLDGWPETDHATAFAGFRDCAMRALQKPYRDTALSPDHDLWVPAYNAALSSPLLESAAAKTFFETYFQPYKMQESGFVTGFYEPEVAASRERTDRFIVALLSKPHDLIKVDNDQRFARQRPDGSIEPFANRQTIETLARQGQYAGKPLAFVEHPVDAFFIHVQGAAKLLLDYGEIMRLTFDGKSGHDFTGPGHILADLREIPRQDVTMQSIRAWFQQNPHRIDEILWQNQSYIFFKERAPTMPNLGPIAAAKVPLRAGYSMAVDRNLHRFGTPIFTHVEGLSLKRLMIAQDTGSAITGAARGDLFMGTGFDAGQKAGVIKNQAEFTLLLPQEAMAPICPKRQSPYE